MMVTAIPILKVALGTYPATVAFKARSQFGSFAIDFVPVSPISRAFAPMVRQNAFDISEMAIITFFQAKAHGKPLVLLPITVAARFQEQALLCRSDDRSIHGPVDLSGRTIGVRAYSQTTGVWLRGIFADDYSLKAEDIRWITFEDAHVAEVRDPAWAERAKPGSDMLEMLRSGELDAVIVGNDVPDDPAFRTVFANPAAASERFKLVHGFVPVNHMVVASRDLVESRQDIVTVLLAEFRAAHNAIIGANHLPMSFEALQAPLELALRYAHEQELLPRSFAFADIWEGLPQEFMI